MSITKWRGVWYVYNHVTREFVRGMSGEKARWTPAIKLAWAYKNPSQAQKCASRLNAALHHPGCACWPCQPVSVVTGEAARCLELINRRDSAAAGTSSVLASLGHLPQRGRHT